MEKNILFQCVECDGNPFRPQGEKVQQDALGALASDFVAL